jgi:hypothetical protein
MRLRDGRIAETFSYVKGQPERPKPRGYGATPGLPGGAGTIDRG